MIKIIKEGKKSFVKRCPRCGCEFVYGLEDIGMTDLVYCPCCGRSIVHRDQAEGEYQAGGEFNGHPVNKTRYATNTSEE